MLSILFERRHHQFDKVINEFRRMRSNIMNRCGWNLNNMENTNKYHKCRGRQFCLENCVSIFHQRICWKHIVTVHPLKNRFSNKTRLSKRFHGSIFHLIEYPSILKSPSKSTNECSRKCCSCVCWVMRWVRLIRAVILVMPMILNYFFLLFQYFIIPLHSIQNHLFLALRWIVITPQSYHIDWSTKK